MNMNERVHYLRESLLGIKSQGRFGERVGLSASTISAIESGKTPLKEANLKAICAEYGVSEAWLRNGEGEALYRQQQTVPYADIEGLSLDEIEMMGIYRQLETRGKESVLAFVTEKLELQRLREAKEKEDKERKITVIDTVVPSKAATGGAGLL